eukprot:8064799-Pyramimonas_sp.AAC.2
MVGPGDVLVTGFGVWRALLLRALRRHVHLLKVWRAPLPKGCLCELGEHGSLGLRPGAHRSACPLGSARVHCAPKAREGGGYG